MDSSNLLLVLLAARPWELASPATGKVWRGDEVVASMVEVDGGTGVSMEKVDGGTGATVGEVDSGAAASMEKMDGGAWASME